MNSFDEFRGNERIVRTLRQALVSGRLPHALLFAGGDGVGKRTLALMLAKALNCAEQGDGFCNECPSCRKIDAGTHPDVLFVGVLEDKQFLHIDQIREARGEVFYRPFEGRCRVIVIDEADRMKDEAANSILKMLEEPPPSTKIVLLTATFHSLLPTIRSRCQIFYFSPLPLEVVRELLETQTTLPAQDRELCARLSQGSIGRALTFDLDQYRIRREAIMAFIGASLAPRSADVVMDMAEVIGKNKDSFEDYMDTFYLIFQDLFYLGHEADEQRITNIDLLPALQRLAQTTPSTWVENALAQLDDIRSGLRVNVNRFVALTDLAFALNSLAGDAATLPRR